MPSEAHEIEIGDGRFDQAFYLEGPAPLLFALLDAETRRLLMAFPENTLRISGGELRAEVRRLNVTDTLRLLLDLAQRFAEPLDVAQRVAKNAREDSSSEVRLRNLLLLVRELPGEALTTEALRAACTDPSPKVRLRAAEVLGAETRGLLRELAESTEDDTAGAQAVAVLGQGLPPERTREILSQALRHRLFKTACACLEVLGGSSDPEDIGLLAQMLAREKSDRLTTVVQALEATNNPAAEPPLLAALQHIRNDVRVAAAKALSRTGTVAAVLPLQVAAGQTRDQDLRRAALQAVAKIQSRLQGASPGQLSLAGNEVGKLSLAEVEAGQLSLADSADGAGGRLSLPPESGPPRPV
jgi:HEAT repeat protein